MQVNDIVSTLRKWQQLGQTIVLATGVFDILHIEHIRFLTAAKNAGDKLIVGIETDKRVSHIKGHHRPVNNQNCRLEQLMALKAVDIAFLLPEKFDVYADWVQFMETIKPDVYAVSSHTQYLQNKREITKQTGSKLEIVHQFNPEYSTTKFYERLISEI